jgi:protoporphyrinogen oxidase
MPPADYGGKHLLYLGNYLPMDHRYFKTPDADVVAEFLPHLTKINPAFDPSWVAEHRVFKLPFAQPVVTQDFEAHIPPLDTPIPNLYLANMFQVYPQDRGQNYSIRLGNKLAAHLKVEDPTPAGRAPVAAET